MAGALDIVRAAAAEAFNRRHSPGDRVKVFPIYVAEPKRKPRQGKPTVEMIAAPGAMVCPDGVKVAIEAPGGGVSLVPIGNVEWSA